MPLAPEQIFGEFGKVAGAVQTGGVNKERRKNLLITVLSRVYIKHEVDQRAFQPGAYSPIHCKPCAGYLGSALQVENAEFRTKFPMRLRSEVETPWNAPPMHFDIFF